MDLITLLLFWILMKAKSFPVFFFFQIIIQNEDFNALEAKWWQGIPPREWKEPFFLEGISGAGRGLNSDFFEDTSILSSEDRNSLVRPCQVDRSSLLWMRPLLWRKSFRSWFCPTLPHSLILVSARFASNSFNQHERKINDWVLVPGRSRYSIPGYWIPSVGNHPCRSYSYHCIENNRYLPRWESDAKKRLP